MDKLRRTILSFQGLRGYAILLIFLSHYPFVLNASGGNALGWAGALGVEMFVMLSGYLAASQYAEGFLSGGVSNLKRKIQKFYPLHILTLIGSAFLFYEELFIQMHLNTWLKLGLNALLFQSWVPLDSVYFSFNAVSWYLCLTVFFVVVAPFVMKYVVRLRASMWLWLTMAIVIIQSIWCLTMENSTIAHWAIYICPVVRLLDYLIGGGVYVIAKSWKQQQRFFKPVYIYIVASVAIATNFLLLVLSANSQSEIYSVWVWTIPVALLLCALGAADTKEPRGIQILFENKAIVLVGNLSFEIFLIHYLIILYANRFGIAQTPIFGLLFGGITLIISWSLKKFTDRIFKKKKVLDRG